MIKPNSVVVLLHGIGRTKRSMHSLETALTTAGYQVLNIDYPSRKKDITSLAQEIYLQLQPYYNQAPYTLHFVTHSMGGLLARTLLSLYPCRNIGRVVMLAPPNQGSEYADWLQSFVLYRLFYGPAGQQLTTHIAKTQPFPLINAELGVIAGDRSLDPLSVFLMPGKHDGKVTVASTQLNQMKDYIVLHASHSFIMMRQKAISQVLYFLAHGMFNR